MAVKKRYKRKKSDSNTDITIPWDVAILVSKLHNDSARVRQTRAKKDN